MSRALLTEQERERIAGNGSDEQRRYEAVSRARRRIDEKLSEDVAVLREHHPTLYAELRDVVCGDETEA